MEGADCVGGQLCVSGQLCGGKEAFSDVTNLAEFGGRCRKAMIGDRGVGSTLLSGISGLSFDSLVLSPRLSLYLILLLFLSCHLSVNGPFS